MLRILCKVNLVVLASLPFPLSCYNDAGIYNIIDFENNDLAVASFTDRCHIDRCNTNVFYSTVTEIFLFISSSIKSVYSNSSNSLCTLRKTQYIIKRGDNWRLMLQQLKCGSITIYVINNTNYFYVPYIASYISDPSTSPT